MHGKAFSSLGIPLDPLTQDSCIFYEDHTVISAQGGAVLFDVDAGKELAAAFPTGKAAIHQNHGLFTVGETVDEAAFWFISMERSCQAQLLAMAAGQPKKINHEFATYTREQTGSRSPAGSASSRCGRTSASLTQSCSSRRFAGALRVSVEPPPAARGRLRQRAGLVPFAPCRATSTPPPEPLFVLGDRPVHGRTIAMLLFDEVAPQPWRGCASPVPPSC